MANIDPISISSEGRAYTVSFTSGPGVMEQLVVTNSSPSWPETIEHISSSAFDDGDSLALHEAREEAARKGLEVSAARLRHQELELEAATAHVQLLEARERSQRTPSATISSLQGSAPTPPAPPIFELPIDDPLRPPAWTIDKFGRPISSRCDEDHRRRMTIVIGRAPQRVAMSPDRAWWTSDHHDVPRGDSRDRMDAS